VTTTEKRRAVSPTYIICKTIGHITHVSGNYLGDEFSPLDRLFGVDNNPRLDAPAPVRLYNLTRGGWADVLQTVRRMQYPGQSLESPEDTSIPNSPHVLLSFTVKRQNGPQWQVGDAYGVPVSPVATLPRNVYFGGTLDPDSSQGQNPMVVFEFKPDGRAENEQIHLVMLNKSGDTGLSRVKTVSVSSDGTIRSQ